MSRPTDQPSIRYGACAVHNTQLTHPVALRTTKRSSISAPTIHGSADALELIGIASDSSPSVQPPSLPSQFSDDGANPGWVLLSGQQRRLTIDNGSSTFGGRPGCAATRHLRRAAGGSESDDSRGHSDNGDVSGGTLFLQTDSAPLPPSHYDDDDSMYPPEKGLIQRSSNATSAGICRTHYAYRNVASGRRPSLQNWSHSLSNNTVSVAVCRLWYSAVKAMTN